VADAVNGAALEKKKRKKGEGVRRSTGGGGGRSKSEAVMRLTNFKRRNVRSFRGFATRAATRVVLFISDIDDDRCRPSRRLPRQGRDVYGCCNADNNALISETEIQRARLLASARYYTRPSDINQCFLFLALTSLADFPVFTRLLSSSCHYIHA